MTHDIREQQTMNCYPSIMRVVAVCSAAAYSATFAQFPIQNTGGYGLWVMGATVGLATSLITACSSSCLSNSGDVDETTLSRGAYLKKVAKEMFVPCLNDRRFFAGFTLVSNCFLLPAEILLMGNMVTARCIVEPLYYLMQASALALPIRQEYAMIGWGLVKGAFQVASLAVCLQNPEQFTPIIVANSLFLATCLAAIGWGAKELHAQRQEAQYISA